MAIEVVPAVGRWDDFASFMVPRKPGGGGCVCVCTAYRRSGLTMPDRITYMRGLCQAEPGPGVLAYVDGEAAGWCSIAPKSTYRALVSSRTIPHLDDEGVWSAVCFVVRPGFRRRGLMHDLLDGALAHARGGGAPAVEGYPVDPGGDRIDQTSGYVGTVSLFEAHGFTRVALTTGRRGGKPRWLVRRNLTDPDVVHVRPGDEDDHGLCLVITQPWYAAFREEPAMTVDLAGRLDLAPELRVACSAYTEEFGGAPAVVWQVPGVQVVAVRGFLGQQGQYHFLSHGTSIANGYPDSYPLAISMSSAGLPTAGAGLPGPEAPSLPGPGAAWPTKPSSMRRQEPTGMPARLSLLGIVGTCEGRDVGD